MKNKFYKILVITTLLFVDTGLTQYLISNSTIISAGQKINGSNYTISNSIGEPIIGKSTTITNQSFAGFWYVYNADLLTDVGKEEMIPTVFKLEQNFPNPFNPSTIIKFAVPERSIVLIRIYDILGSEIITLVNEEMEAGWYQKNFNAQSLASGVYLFRMEAGNYVNTKKMVLLR
jgi:hypothetical protein